MKNNYSTEENEILAAFEAGTLKKSKNSKKEISVAKETALNTFSRKKQIKITLTEKEIDKLKMKAFEAGLSYHSLIRLLIHNYTDDRIHIKL